MEYPKIENLFERDPETHRLTTVIRRPEFKLPKTWVVTEKIDGMNIRICYEHGILMVRGRTDRAVLPPKLVSHLMGTLSPGKIADVFGMGSKVTLFGEGYGAGIQRGGVYGANQSFRLFDVVVYGDYPQGFCWLNWPNVLDVAGKLDIPAVPYLGDYDLDAAIDLTVLRSCVALDGGLPDTIQEGIVARTEPLLFDRFGGRVMWKLKARDVVA